MKKSVVNHYGIDLDNKYNRLVTEGWDTAQLEV